MEHDSEHRPATPSSGGSTTATLTIEGQEEGAVRQVRRWAAAELVRAGLSELRDDVELVVGELVANALLHAGTPVHIELVLAPPRVTVEVCDPSTVLPIWSGRDHEAMTGRGMSMVARVSRAWGAERTGAGKRIRVELEAGAGAGTGPSTQPEEVTDAPTDDRSAVGMASAADEERFTVRLGDVPTDLLMAAKAHVDDIVREFALASAGERSGTTGEVPTHLAQLLETVVHRFAEPRQLIKRQALAAANAGEGHVHLELRLPVSAADAGEEYLEALDAVDAYCRAARLLTLETPPAHRVFRHWYVQELIVQLRRAAAGGPPQPSEPFEDRLIAEIDSVARAQRSADRSARLTVLAGKLSEAVTPEEVAHCALAEGAAAMEASGGGLLLTGRRFVVEVPATVGYDESVVAGLRAESPDAQLPAAHAARAREPVWLESRQETDARFPALAGFEPATVSMCALPLIAGDRCLGALRFSFGTARLFDAEEREFALSLARQTAQALERARLYHQEAEGAARLRRRLLPAALPDVPGLELASHYGPAVVDIGGDFYDLVGAGSEWMVVVGDVRGKGIDAAVSAAMARNTVRAAARSGLGPAAILRLLNVAFHEDQTPEEFCTAVCGQLSVRAGGATLHVANGGHPDPLILRADGSIEAIAGGGMLLGVSPDVELTPTTVTLSPGDLVLLYTDGVTEARSGDDLFGRQRLERQLGRCTGCSAEEAVERVRAAVEEFQRGQRDDMAMLAIRLPEREGGG